MASLGADKVESQDVAHVDTSYLNKLDVKGADGALEFLRDSSDGSSIDFTLAEMRRVRWKIDLLVLPLMVITFILNFLDKAILSNASVFGLQETLDLQGQQYSWLGSIFYFGYLLGQPLTAYLVHKVPAGRYLCINLFLWGVTCISFAGTNSFATAAVARFFLGLFEACINPTFVVLTAQFYTRKEQSLRTCIWWTGSPIGGFIGDTVTWGIGHGHGSLPPWKYMYICFGGATVLFSFVMLYFFPSTPYSMKALTEKERKLAVLRVIDNHTGVTSNKFKIYQMYEALIDPQVWIFVLITFVQCLPSGGISSFNKLIITGLGYTNLQATVMSMPEHAVQLVSIILAGVIGTYLKNARTFAMIGSNIPCVIGAALVYYLPSSQNHIRLAGLYLLFFNTISYIMCMSLISSNIAGMTKKATAAAMMFLSYTVGNLAAPQFFKSSQAPRYTSGFLGMLISFFIMIGLEVVLLAYLVWENKRRDRKYGPPNISGEVGSEFLDLTDKEQPQFRYIW